MTSPLRINLFRSAVCLNAVYLSAVLGGATVLALGAASVSAAAETSAAASDGAEVQRIMVVRDGGEGRGEHGPGLLHRGGDPERRATRLRDLLQLTPAQEPALQAFLSAMHPPHDGADRHAPGGERSGEHGPPPSDPAARRAEMDKRMGEMKARIAEREKTRAEEAALTTPQRLDRMVKAMADHMARRQAEVEAHVAAIKQFYAALTPAQQKAFDALHDGMVGGGMGPGHGGRMMMPMGMGEGPTPPRPPLPPFPPLALRTPPLPALPPEPPLSPY